MDTLKKLIKMTKKYMKIKLNLDDKLPLNNAIETGSIIIVARTVFQENKKYYPQVFLDECLYKLFVWIKQSNVIS